MNKNIIRMTAIGLGGLALAAGAWTAAASPYVPTDTTSITSTVSAELSFMRDEERLARDLYQAIAAQYDNAVPFSTIAVSEQRHFDSVGLLLTRYGLDDPAAGKTAGVYSEPELQALYDSLLAQSKVSIDEAYKVGIAVETKDIADLKEAIDDATQADIDRVYANLLNGSESHLQAFTDAAAGIVHDVAAGTMNQNANGYGMQGGMVRAADGTVTRAQDTTRIQAQDGTGVGVGARAGQTRGAGMYGAGDGTCITE